MQKTKTYLRTEQTNRDAENIEKELFEDEVI